MRHRNSTFKVGRNTGHRRCLLANMVKSLILHGKIETSLTKAKEVRRHAERMIRFAKENTLASRRRAIAKLMVRFNAVSVKEAASRDPKQCNSDRLVIDKLFELGARFSNRAGGYTRITRKQPRVGDSAEMCVIEYLSE